MLNLKTMNVVIFMSGHVRQYYNFIDNFKSKILYPLKKNFANVWLHGCVWDNVNTVRCHSVYNRPESACYIFNEKVDVHKLISDYGFDSIVIKNEAAKQDFLEEMALSYTNVRDKSNAFATVSQCYMIGESYETIDSEFKFDIAIRCRFDIKFSEHCNIVAAIKELYGGNYDVVVENEGYDYNWISDKFAIIKPSGKTSFVYRNLSLLIEDEYFRHDQKIPLCLETYLALVMRTYNIRVKKSDNIGLISMR